MILFRVVLIWMTNLDVDDIPSRRHIAAPRPIPKPQRSSHVHTD